MTVDWTNQKSLVHNNCTITAGWNYSYIYTVYSNDTSVWLVCVQPTLTGMFV